MPMPCRRGSNSSEAVNSEEALSDTTGQDSPKSEFAAGEAPASGWAGDSMLACIESNADVLT